MAEASTSDAEQNNTTQTKDRGVPAVQNENAAVPPYAKSHLRVSKASMFMILALRLEEFPVDEVPTRFVEEPCRKVGAVLVLPDDELVWAADCSRDGVHAVARLLMKHHDKAKGCKMFVSRKPCRICAKLLVQSKVKQVLYLPLEPEYYRSPEKEPDVEKRKKIEELNKTQMKQVDNLFAANPIGQTKFVPQVEKSVLLKAREETPKEDEKKGVPEQLKNELIKKYHFDANSTWLDAIEEELPWPAFDKIKGQVKEYFHEVMEWIARVIILSGGDQARGREYEFTLNQLSKQPNSSSHLPYPAFDPTKKDSNDEQQAKHFIEMARFLAQRTDDPETGVGAVIVSYRKAKMEVISIGWNGFPLKAHYGEFARASHGDDAEDNKLPYVIHAEQNALMLRNKKNIEGAILFVTSSPCDECAPLIAMEGIETVIVDENVGFRDEKEPNKDKPWPANVFPGMVEDGSFICYQTKRCATDAKNISASKEKSKNLEPMLAEK